MPDTAVGFVLLGTGILVVLGVVFAISSRAGGPSAASAPPRGVHMPGPSFLPVVMSLAVALMGAGLVFRADDQLANPFLAIPGLLVFVVGAVAWVRAANHEWSDVEHGSHDDGSAH
ncbi:MAG: hypothetical protein ACR2GO_06140 [Candidatus Limnocylindria bacterium]